MVTGTGTLPVLDCPLVSETVIVTMKFPVWVGVPETTPVTEFTLTPGGRPVTDHEYGGRPPLAERVAK